MSREVNSREWVWNGLIWVKRKATDEGEAYAALRGYDGSDWQNLQVESSTHKNLRVALFEQDTLIELSKLVEIIENCVEEKHSYEFSWIDQGVGGIWDWSRLIPSDAHIWIWQIAVISTALDKFYVRYEDGLGHPIFWLHGNATSEHKEINRFVCRRVDRRGWYLYQNNTELVLMLTIETAKTRRIPSSVTAANAYPIWGRIGPSCYASFSSSDGTEVELDTYDFGDVYTFNLIGMRVGAWIDTATTGSFLKIYTSEDGSTWNEEFSTGDLETSEKIYYWSAENKKLRYVKVTINSASTSATAYAKIYKLLAWE